MTLESIVQRVAAECFSKEAKGPAGPPSMLRRAWNWGKMPGMGGAMGAMALGTAADAATGSTSGRDMANMLAMNSMMGGGRGGGRSRSLLSGKGKTPAAPAATTPAAPITPVAPAGPTAPPPPAATTPVAPVGGSPGTPTPAVTPVAPPKLNLVAANKGGENLNLGSNVKRYNMQGRPEFTPGVGGRPEPIKLGVLGRLRQLFGVAA